MRMPLPRQMHVLHNRNYLLYWCGQLVSLTGTWMQAVAQGPLVLKLSHSVFALGIVNFAVMMPTLVLTLTGGVVADRWDRRRIMIATQAALMSVAFITAGLLAADRLTFAVLLGVSALIGVATAYDLPAQQALVPDLVSPPEIPQAIAMNQVIFNGSRLLGPAIAAVALTTFSFASLYFINGVSFVAVIASLMLIRLPAGRARGGARGSMIESLREGLGYVRRSRLLRSLFLTTALSVLLMFPPMAVLPAGYVSEVMHRGKTTFGLLMAASGAASMVGAFAMLWIPVPRRGHVMALAVVTMAVSVGMMAWSSNVVAVVAATGGLSVGFSMLFGLIATTVQQTVPGALRGRVMSVSGLTFSGVLPFAALLVSFAVDRFGFTPVYLVSAAVFVIAGLALVLRSGILGYVPSVTSHGSGPGPTPSREAEFVGVGGE
jgi:MFS family permease